MRIRHCLDCLKLAAILPLVIVVAAAVTAFEWIAEKLGIELSEPGKQPKSLDR